MFFITFLYFPECIQDDEVIYFIYNMIFLFIAKTCDAANLQHPKRMETFAYKLLFKCLNVKRVQQTNMSSIYIHTIYITCMHKVY